MHINVADPTPVRGPTYRYPEKAKDIISKLVQEMESEVNKEEEILCRKLNGRIKINKEAE